MERHRDQATPDMHQHSALGSSGAKVKFYTNLSREDRKLMCAYALSRLVLYLMLNWQHAA
jgi:hypothetical protein